MDRKTCGAGNESNRKNMRNETMFVTLSSFIIREERWNN